MAKETRVEKPTPAYFPWQTFENFVTSLKSTAVPPVIDSSVMRSMSGSTQSMIRTGLRFLGLTTEGDAVTEQFRKLIAAYGDKAAWHDEMSQVISDAYRIIIEGLDLDNGTEAQLMRHFREQGGASGSVLTKSVRFFLAAMRSAGWQYSPHFGVTREAAAQDGNGLRKPRRKRAVSPPSREREESSSAPPPGTEGLRLALPGKPEVVLHVPEGITEAEWGIVDGYVRAYIKLKK